jgi:hypothetical protein
VLAGLMACGLETQRWFSSHGIPAVVSGTCDASLGVPFVCLDNHALGRHAAVTLLQHGHRQIAALLMAAPLTLGLTLFTWLVLWKFYAPVTVGLQIERTAQTLTSRGWFVVGVFVVTVLLWMSDRWHGLPPAVVALLPTGRKLDFSGERFKGRGDEGKLKQTPVVPKASSRHFRPSARGAGQRRFHAGKLTKHPDLPAHRWGFEGR